MNTQIKKAISMAILTFALASAVGIKQVWASECPQDDCKLDSDTFFECLPSPLAVKAGYTTPSIVQRAGGVHLPAGPAETDEYVGCLDCNGDCLKEGVYRRKRFFDCFTANANGDLFTVDIPMDPPGGGPPVTQKIPLSNGQVSQTKTIIGTTSDCQENFVPLLPPTTIPTSIVAPARPIVGAMG